VPWNGPWYLRHGFAELPRSAWGPQLRRHWQAEIDAGLHDLGPRLVLHFPGTWLPNPPPALKARLFTAARVPRFPQLPGPLVRPASGRNFVSLLVSKFTTNRAPRGPKVIQRRKVMRSEPLTR
jgi:hypothetical protein